MNLKPGLFIVFFLVSCYCQAQRTVTMSVDGLNRLQTIDGIGVNVNSRSWNNGELKPAIDLLVDSLQANIFRVIVETPKEWEDINDNDNAFVYNWKYYDSLYSTIKFTNVWETIAYLNTKGITENVMINLMGYLPGWMGGETVDPIQEDEFVEMFVSFLHYARHTKYLQFGLVAPFNESDIQKEGPRLNEFRYVAILKKIIERMRQGGMADILIVGPDAADMKNNVLRYIPEMMKDSTIMSSMFRFAVHSYGGYYAPVDSLIKKSKFPDSKFWVTEWNAWRDGLDDGIMTAYNYQFAEESIIHLIDLLRNGAAAALVWEAYDSYYDHHAPSLFSYWGILEYNKQKKEYYPRKHFYAISQISKYVTAGSWQINLKSSDKNSPTIAFFNPSLNAPVIVGINKYNKPLQLEISVENLPNTQSFQLIFTDSTNNLKFQKRIIAGKTGKIKVSTPANSIYTLVGEYNNVVNTGSLATKLKKKGWYAGDIHVHRNCGEGTPVFSIDSLAGAMKKNELSVISVLADMGNGEVANAKTDLSLVTGKDAAQSTADAIVHWDAEWHWDATYSSFSNQALGGHLVLLGLTHAKQIWEESPYKILEWAKTQNAVRGFAHLEYLNNNIPNKLNCCIPVDLPVEAALQNIDFVSTDVFGSYSFNNGSYYGNESLEVYYKLLNCGIKLGLAAGTDFPCNNFEPLGTLRTYANVDSNLTYRKWIDALKQGKTVISKLGGNEFLELKVNGNQHTGASLNLSAKEKVTIEITWDVATESKGDIQLLYNGKVISTVSGTSSPGKPLVLKTNIEINESSWIAARKINNGDYQSHTSPIYLHVNGEKIKGHKEDAEYFVKWIDNILNNISDEGKWMKFFPGTLAEVRTHYQRAKDYYTAIVHSIK